MRYLACYNGWQLCYNEKTKQVFYFYPCDFEFEKQEPNPKMFKRDYEWDERDEEYYQDIESDDDERYLRALDSSWWDWYRELVEWHRVGWEPIRFQELDKDDQEELIEQHYLNELTNITRDKIQKEVESKTLTEVKKC